MTGIVLLVYESALNTFFLIVHFDKCMGFKEDNMKTMACFARKSTSMLSWLHASVFISL